MKKLSNEVTTLLSQRYLKPEEDWSGLVSRVVNHVCKEELLSFKADCYEDILNRVWLPNSPALVNSGTQTGGLMACFVVGPDEDNLENHVAVLGDIAAVGKRGGGCGFTGTFIRQEGAPVAGSAHGYAYGPNKWAVQVSGYLDMITQGGFRNMALMYSLRSDHPDLEKFISLKQNNNERFCYNFNQSVMATHTWMRAALQPFTKENILLWRIAKNAWTNGDPGLLFYTTINENTPYKMCGCSLETTNPCGEQPLPSYGSCNLGSINVAHDLFFDSNNRYKYSHLANVASRVTQFLDNVGSANIFPNDKFKIWYEDHRPVGVGIMGFADLCLRMEIAYGSQESLQVLAKILGTIQLACLERSKELGQLRGIPSHCKNLGRRNITVTSIAPTGSIGFLAECSHSIEPIFSPRYKRTDERGETYTFIHPLADKPFFVSSIGARIPTWQQHIDVQAVAQRYVDSAISKTINMPHEASVSDVFQAMIYAWENECKGVTIYRDGSRSFQILEDIKEEDQAILDCPNGICEI